MMKPFHGIKAVVFDFDGTIADTCEHLIMARYTALDAMGIKRPERDAVTAVLGVSLREGFMLAAGVANERALAELADLYNESLTDLAMAAPCYQPGAEKVLSALRSRGIKVGVESLRRDEDMRRVAVAWGLDRLVDTVAGDDLTDKSRPAPDLINLMSERMGTDPEQTLVVGDTVYDIEMGRNAGSVTAGYTRGAHTERVLAASCPDAIIGSLQQILALI